LQRVVPFGGLLLFFVLFLGRCTQSQRALFPAFQRSPSPTHRHCGDCAELRLQHFVEDPLAETRCSWEHSRALL
jgi:hypothetical protein